MKHTKGPWHIIEVSKTKEGEPSMLYLANPTPHVHGILRGASDADCALISAAPEILEAAELLLYRLEVAINDLNEYGEHSMDCDLEIEDLKKAIQKAKGE